jgi:hypothetical protein
MSEVKVDAGKVPAEVEKMLDTIGDLPSEEVSNVDTERLSADYEEDEELANTEDVADDDAYIFGEDSNEVTRDLPFKPNPNKFNGICLCYVESIHVDEVVADTVNDKGEESMYEYAGLPIRNVSIIFVQNPETVNGERRVMRYRTNVPVFYNNRGEEIEERIVRSLIENQFSSLRHILNVFGVEEKTPLKFGGDVKQRLKSWNRWITNIGGILQTIQDNVVNKPFYLKVVADFSTRKRYELPKFVGTGFIERVVKNNQEPTLELNGSESIVLSKGDDIIPNVGKSYSKGSGSIDEDVLKALGI